MPRSARASLLAVRRATEYLSEKGRTETLASYLADETLQFAVERNFITIGEAIAQLRQDFPDVAARIPDSAEIKAFRNFIIHQYWEIDAVEVWSVLVLSVPALRSVADQLLADPSVL